MLTHYGQFRDVRSPNSCVSPMVSNLFYSESYFNKENNLWGYQIAAVSFAKQGGSLVSVDFALRGLSVEFL